VLGLPFLYLGYWIAESRKMAYKATFRPAEGLINGSWVALGRRKEMNKNDNGMRAP
jgi:arginine-tRNA-protein transferase